MSPSLFAAVFYFDGRGTEVITVIQSVQTDNEHGYNMDMDMDMDTDMNRYVYIVYLAVLMSPSLLFIYYYLRYFISTEEEQRLYRVSVRDRQ